ncbi:MAG: Extracellular solute-binding protein [Candidatus Magnetoglobus multicellularis str. Araruama]|uniref:Extracellular solute-binding protein n=1 Tax=Candidatus Magnetoglobus multicellularis str. Araruama TaxID=890399 RepID=A0A1V1PDA3_9BACT|nr:MAG: Extracellular solute-binding protein [Candidatus Magnetoglobus multicellularis str. Araruama]
MIQKISVTLWIICMLFSSYAIADNLLIKVDCRQRPPEMIYNDDTKKCSGPLIDILNEAVTQVGGKVEWERRPFQKSYSLLKRGVIDILPRVIKTSERKEDVRYFSAIGYQVKPIVFAVKKGHENDIQKFQDLQKYRIGAKRGTVYFDEFNDNRSIYKIHAIDDIDLSRKFIHGRCDAVILLDIKAFEKIMKSMKSDNFAYAKYQYPKKIGNHYAMSLKSKRLKLFDKLNTKIQNMTTTGKVKQIYENYNLVPPMIDTAKR